MIAALKQHLSLKTQGLLHHFFQACAKDMEISQAGRSILVIAPHPDDESLGCGATIARLRSLGKKVFCIIVTDGSACGHSAFIGPEEIAAARQRETTNAAAILGVPPEDVVFLNFADQQTEKHAADIETALAGQIAAFKPSQIFSPYGTDGHPDHRIIAEAVDQLCLNGVITCPVYEYPVWFWTYGALSHLVQPQKLLRLRRVASGDFLGAKKAAIAAHHSQHEAMTGEAGWFTFPAGFLSRFLMPFELFFEKMRPPNKRQ